MKKINRMLINICSKDLKRSRLFYTKLFDFEVDFDSDWFVHLISKDKQFELGIIDFNHGIVPGETKAPPGGFYITFVVDNADAVFELVRSEGYEILSEPTDTFYGQRRLLIRDPDGATVDVSSPIPNFEF